MQPLHYFISECESTQSFFKYSDPSPVNSYTFSKQVKKQKEETEKEKKAARQQPLPLFPLCGFSPFLLQGLCESAGVVFV